MDEAFSSRLRQAVIDLVTCPTCHRPRFTKREVSRTSGIPEPTLRRFLAGGPLRLSTVDKLILWLRQNGIEVRP